MLSSLLGDYIIEFGFYQGYTGALSIQTTDVYARTDSKQKREALEKAYVEVVPETDREKPWERSGSLLEWLKGLGK